MGWLIGIFVVAMVLGPILYLKPSAKDKRLAALRLLARQNSLGIKLDRLPRLDPELVERVTAGGEKRQPQQACVAYQRNLGPDTNLNLVGRFLRVPDAPTVPFEAFAPGWAHDEKHIADWRRVESEKLDRAVREILQSAPDYCLAFSIDSRFLSCYWRELADAAGPEIEEIRSFLQQAEEKILAAAGQVGPAKV